MAARNDRIDDIKTFLKRWVKVDRTTEILGKKGITALNMAVMGGWNEIVKILLESGVEVDKAGYCGTTPLYMASKKGHLEVVKWLVEDGKVEVDKARNDGWTPFKIAKYY